MIKPELVRSSYIWTILKDEISKKWLTITEVANKIWSSRPTINNMLNWRTSWTDSTYEKIMVWIWMTQLEINELFKSADLEAFKFKHWDIKIDPLEDVDFNFDVALRKEFGWEIDDETISKIKDFIEHVKFLKRKG